MLDLWAQRLLPFLQSQGLTGAEINLLSKTKLVAPIKDATVESIIKWLTDAGVIAELGSFLVFFPRICHAVLFSTGLLLDSTDNELLNVTNNAAWSQTQYMERIDDGRLETRECAMNNPSFFFGSITFWLMKRPYYDDLALHGMATQWGHWCKQRAMKLPDQSYIKDIASMPLYEACLLICIEHAALKGSVVMVERGLKNERPKTWKVHGHGADIFPPYFYSADADTTWNTIFSGKRANGSLATPWLNGLHHGDEFVDIRLDFITDGASYQSWQNEIAALSDA